MTKLGKSCILRIATSHLYFIVKESQTISSSPLIWCALEEGHFFSEYAMEGLSAADNEIYLEFVAGSYILIYIYLFTLDRRLIPDIFYDSRKCCQNIECPESLKYS